ncbi:MAG: alpha/beta fold hydrolase [Moraxellaceae bacterium]|nr:MAG: alpha/beta fold hydrolase [Moraxellaceae bacterium]
MPLKYVIFVILVALASCTPATQMQRICADCNQLIIATALSPIRVWLRAGADKNSSFTLNNLAQPIHVYIENDGAAYDTPTQIAANPSLRAGFLVLRLMQQDSTPSLYISRPCYGFAFNQMPAACEPRYWSTARYSADVVQILSQALDETKRQLNINDAPIVLIGHSGGASLALLIAQGRTDVRAVVTLAGNLDTDAWVKLHGYAALDQSLNPQAQPLLPPDVKRWHFTGADDENIPPSLIERACEKDQEKMLIKNFQK